VQVSVPSLLEYEQLVVFTEIGEPVTGVPLSVTVPVGRVVNSSLTFTVYVTVVPAPNATEAGLAETAVNVVAKSLTVIDVVPDDPAYVESPWYVAVMVYVPSPDANAS
jgi:hypothetical protein